MSGLFVIQFIEEVYDEREQKKKSWRATRIEHEKIDRRVVKCVEWNGVRKWS